MAAQGQALRGNNALGQALRGNTDRIRGGKIYNRSLEANTKGEGQNHCTYDSIARGPLSQRETEKSHLFLNSRALTVFRSCSSLSEDVHQCASPAGRWGTGRASARPSTAASDSSSRRGE